MCWKFYYCWSALNRTSIGSDLMRVTCCLIDKHIAFLKIHTDSLPSSYYMETKLNSFYSFFSSYCKCVSFPTTVSPFLSYVSSASPSDKSRSWNSLTCSRFVVLTVIHVLLPVDSMRKSICSCAMVVWFYGYIDLRGNSYATDGDISSIAFIPQFEYLISSRAWNITRFCMFWNRTILFVYKLNKRLMFSSPYALWANC